MGYCLPAGLHYPSIYYTSYTAVPPSSIPLPPSHRLRTRANVQINPRSRSKAELSIDGREVGELGGHESVVIRKSPYPIPCIERPGGGSWVRDIK
jgi:NAD kinase